jgi:sigma-B regulation protein RsbU (phosphoserine phosphatase)
MNLFFKKKQIKGYPKSFAKRLTWRIMLRMIIIMGIPMVVVFWLIFGMVTMGSVAISERILKGEREEVRRITSDIYVASTNTAPIIEENIQNPDKVRDIINRMLKINPYMRSCGIYFVEGYYPQKGRLYAPYASRRDSIVKESQDASDQGNDYVKDQWFKDAIASKTGYWAKPFHDNDSAKTPLVSYLLPIRDSRDSTVAVMGVDLSLAWMNEKIQFFTPTTNDTAEWKAEQKFYYYITDSTGTYVVHPDTKRMANEKIQHFRKKIEDEDIDSATINDSKGEHFILDDEKVIVCSQEVKYTDWTIAFVLPELIIDIIGYIIAGFSVIFLVLGLLVVYFFGRRSIKKSVKPLQQLAMTADEVAKGNFNTALPEVNTHDEIHQLRDSFEQMQLSLKQYVADLREATAQKAAIENEMKVAHDIQMSMLPKTFPPYPERSDLDIFGSVTPAKGVGGDLFDFYIRDEQLFFCIGDVSGKGVPASLYMAVTRSLFRNISQHVSEPARIVNALNQAQSEGNDTNMFVTLFVGALDLKTGKLSYCNAGHDAPLLMNSGVTLLPCDCNLPIGVIADFNFEQQEITLEQTTTIFLFTDGLNEAENIDHAQFGDERIMELATSLATDHLLQPTQVTRHMTDAVHTFVGTAEQSDDLTMLAIQYKKETVAE